MSKILSHIYIWYMGLLSSLCRLIWNHEEHRILVKYILLSFIGCVHRSKSILTINYTIYWSVCFKLIQFSFDYCENIWTSFYYQNRTVDMSNQPLYTKWYALYVFLCSYDNLWLFRLKKWVKTKSNEMRINYIDRSAHMEPSVGYALFFLMFRYPILIIWKQLESVKNRIESVNTTSI